MWITRIKLWIICLLCRDNFLIFLKNFEKYKFFYKQYNFLNNVDNFLIYLKFFYKLLNKCQNFNIFKILFNVDKYVNNFVQGVVYV